MTTLSVRRFRTLNLLSESVTRVAQAHTAWRHRKALRDLPDAILQDIGLSRAEAEIEARRPFWDVPANWRR